MGEKETGPFQFTFNGLLKVAFQGSHITSDAGLILVRELDERLGLEQLITDHLSDSRHGTNTQFRVADLLRQSVYSRLAGYEDLNDAVRLSTDPTFRLIGSPKRWDRTAALTSTLHWFETELLTREGNLVGLMALNRDMLAQTECVDHADRVVLDMDSSESPVHGQQEGSAYNGHFESVCYHPLFLFNGHGDCLAAKLRSGNVHSADDWDELLLPEIDRQQAAGTRVAFRADAAFAIKSTNVSDGCFACTRRIVVSTAPCSPIIDNNSVRRAPSTCFISVAIFLQRSRYASSIGFVIRSFVLSTNQCSFVASLQVSSRRDDFQENRVSRCPCLREEQPLSACWLLGCARRSRFLERVFDKH